jgi:hypothetical protein
MTKREPSSENTEHTRSMMLIELSCDGVRISDDDMATELKHEA